MKIIYLCNKHYYDTKMSRVRFHAIEELSKLVYVKWWGIGYEGYNNNISVQENLDTLEYKYDIAIAYKPLEMKNFKDIDIPKCITYNEMFDVELTKNEIIKTGANLVICAHLNEMQYYKDLDVKLVHLNHCANHNIFRNMGLEKEYDFMLIGSIWDRYPLRIRMTKILEKLSSQFKVTRYQHPGYLLNSAYDNKHLEDFTTAINKTKIAITCTGKYKSRYGKLVEVPMCGTALACDLPDQEQDVFSKFLINIDNSMSDDEIIEVLKNSLFNTEEREKKEEIGLNYAQNFTQELYATRFIKVIYDYLDKDINYDHNIQGLWIGGELSNMEILSMKSFLHNNHNYHLYTYETIDNVPEGVLVKDGNEILPKDQIFRYENGSVSAFSNLFRYRLLFEKGGYWVDTDYICLKHFDFTDEYIFSVEPWNNYSENKLNPCLMKAPKLSFPMFEGFKYCLSKKQEVLDGKIQWDLGPSSLLHIVSSLNMYDYVKDWTVFNLFSVEDWYSVLLDVEKLKNLTLENNVKLITPYFNNINNLPKNNYGVHLYNEIWRNNTNIDKSYNYDKHCLYEELMRKYNVVKTNDTKIKFDIVLKDNNIQFKIDKE